MYCEKSKMMIMVIMVVYQLLSLCQSAPTTERFANYLQSTDLKTNNLCKKNSDHSDMCEKCAKLSRNQFVFPLCCANDQEVGDWCESYINYTID